MVHSISPEFGTTAGGTEITITGSNFKEKYCEVEGITVDECEAALSYCNGGMCSNTDFNTEEECLANGECLETGTCLEDDMLLTEIDCLD